MAKQARFEWDEAKNQANHAKHHVRFELAQHAFTDPQRVIAKDVSHSQHEERFYCFGKVGGGVMTVRFTWREGIVRIFGAGYWRKGNAIYEQQNSLHR
ncbi:MAG: BrnT family toxin [Rhodanobacteraceae bacterium]